MVKRYRPWSDHGGSPVLEELDADGLTPPLAPEIYPDYDTVVVLYADYAALEARCLRYQRALNELLPGLILDLRYADRDDDRDAMQSRIDTIIDALNGSETETGAESHPTALEAAFAKEPERSIVNEATLRVAAAEPRCTTCGLPIGDSYPECNNTFHASAGNRSVGKT